MPGGYRHSLGLPGIQDYTFLNNIYEKYVFVLKEMVVENSVLLHARINCLLSEHTKSEQNLELDKIISMIIILGEENLEVLESSGRMVVSIICENQFSNYLQ